MNNSKVIIIGQNYSTSYGVIRALGEAGFRCEVGKRIHNTPPNYLTPELKSKYVDKFVYVRTDDDESMIEDIISNFAVIGDKKVLIPTDDFCAALVDRNLKELQKYFYLPNINGISGEVSKMMDKLHQKDIVRNYNLKTAEICVVDRKEDIDRSVSQNITYPCFVKPLSSAGNPKHLMRKCDSYDELIAGLIDAFDERGCQMLVERYLEVEEEYTIPVVAVGGEVFIPSLLEKNGIGSGGHKGVTITGKVLSAAQFGELVGELKRFIKDVGLTGIFDIEILYSQGELYFNELNLRNGAAGYALTASGINLPALYVQSMLDGKPVNWDAESFKPGKTFVNEKAAFEYYIAGYSTFADFVKSVRRADIRFLLSNSDIKAAVSFIKLMARSIKNKRKR